MNRKHYRPALARLVTLTALLALALARPAAAANLVTNPEFRADEAGFVIDWTMDQLKHPGAVTLLPGEGVDGADALRLDLTKLVRFVQPGITLVAGEKYRLGGYVRTNGFKAPRKSIIIYNSGWTREVGTRLIPETTDGWLKLEAEIEAPESKNSVYYFAIYATESQGTVDFCSPFLEPLTEKGLAESRPIPQWEHRNRRLVPIYPLLSRVDITRPTMDFYYAPRLPKGLAAYEVRVATRTGDSAGFTAPAVFPLLTGNRCQTVLGGLKLGQGQLQAELVDKETGETLASNIYTIRVIEPAPPATVKPLNNLVGELLNTPAAETTLDFTNPRDGWVYIGFDKPSPDAEVYLDDEAAPVVRHRPGEASETMRFLGLGPHRLRVVQPPAGSRLHVRTVPQLMVYPLTVVPKTDVSIYRYDLDFFRRHLWHSFNFHNTGAWMPKSPLDLEVDAELKERGIGVIGSIGLGAGNNPEKLAASIRASRTLPTTLGLTIDELGANADPVQQLAVADACWELQDFDKTVYTWICGGCELSIPVLHKNVFSACTNVSQGKGKILFETYVVSQPTEEEADRHLDERVGNIMRYARHCAPDAAERVMFMMTGLTTNGIYNVNVYPQVDIKYYFDMFFHKVATDPAAQGMFGIGCYNISHCDEELTRWIAKLVRHYGVDGNTDLLSRQYGLTYLPGHLQNCDFENGFDGWTAAPATPESLRPLTVKDYGRKHLQRRGKPQDTGDTTAYFERQADGVNTLSQTAVNLVPGKLYALAFVTGDPEDVEKAKNVHQHPMVRVSLDHAEVLPDLSYDVRYPKGWSGGWAQWTYLREIITTRVVFKATAEQVTLTFSDAEGTPGQKRLLNFINLKPYIAE